MYSASASVSAARTLSVKKKKEWSKEDVTHFDSVLARLKSGEIKSRSMAAKLCGIGESTFRGILSRGVACYDDFLRIPTAGRPRVFTKEEEDEIFLNLEMLNGANMHYTLDQLCEILAVYAARPGCHPGDIGEDNSKEPPIKPLDRRTVKELLERHGWSSKKAGRAAADKWSRVKAVDTRPYFAWLRERNEDLLTKPGSTLILNMDESSVVLRDADITERGFNRKDLNTHFCEQVAADTETFMKSDCHRLENCYLMLDNVASHSFSGPLTQTGSVEVQYFPPRTRGDLQPCDHSSLFGIFKTLYKKNMNEFHSQYRRNVQTSRTAMAAVVLKTAIEAFTPAHIESAFRGCGIGSNEKLIATEKSMEVSRLGNSLAFGLHASQGVRNGRGVVHAEADAGVGSQPESAAGAEPESEPRAASNDAEIERLQRLISDSDSQIMKIRLEQIDNLARLQRLGGPMMYAERLASQVGGAFPDTPAGRRAQEAFSLLVASRIAHVDRQILAVFSDPAALKGRRRREGKIRLEENVASTPSQLFELAKRDIAAQPARASPSVKKTRRETVSDEERKARATGAVRRNKRKVRLFKDLTNEEKAEYEAIGARDTETKDSFLRRNPSSLDKHEELVRKRKAAAAPPAAAAPSKRRRMTMSQASTRSWRSTRSMMKKAPWDENAMDEDDDDDDDDDYDDDGGGSESEDEEMDGDPENL